MKTTIEINDALLQQAKQAALDRKLTLKAVVEAALRQFLDRPSASAQAGSRPNTYSFKGQGLQPGLDENDFATIRAMAYEGRGG